jgi:hypothetical protein
MKNNSTAVDGGSDPTVPPAKRNPEEVEALKNSWLSDGGWDLAATDGFEAHREELEFFVRAKKSFWLTDATKALQGKAAALGIPENLELAAYVLNLESRLSDLESLLPRPSGN